MAQMDLIDTEGSFEKQLDSLLSRLRETLHSKGRLSSRNEALEELSKLLFVHLMSLASGGPGISRALINDAKTSPAAALSKFVKETADRCIPEGLASELKSEDFQLRIKAQETSLASELIGAFEELRSTKDIKNQLLKTDIFNEIFSKFLADSFIDEKQLGQYLTPREVIQFIVELAIAEMSPDELKTLTSPSDVRSFGYVLDPSCGVGSFLTEVSHQISRQVRTLHGEEGVDSWAASFTQDVLVGIDKSERMIKLALTNLAMFGHSAANLHLANSLLRQGEESSITESLNGKVALILTNPPFGAEFEDADICNYEIAKDGANKLSSEALFFERYIDWLKPGGQLVAIVPDSILTNRGIFEQLRKRFGPQVELRSIVSLPPVTFAAAGTSTKTSVLHLRKVDKEASKRPALFAVAESIGYDVATRGNQKLKVANGKNDLPPILNEFKSKSGNSFGRWLSGIEQAERWDANFHATLSVSTEKRLKQASANDLRLSDVAVLAKDRIDPRRLGKLLFDYIEISDVDSATLGVASKKVKCSEAPSRARKVVKANDVLVSTVRPERRTVGIVKPCLDGAICTTGFAVLRPKEIDPVTLAYLLRSDFVIEQLMRRNIGIAYPAIDEEVLLDVLLPISKTELSSLSKTANELLQQEIAIEEMRKRFGDQVASAQNQWLVGASGDSTLHQSTKTMSRRRPRTEDSDAHDLDILEI